MKKPIHQLSVLFGGVLLSILLFSCSPSKIELVNYYTPSYQPYVYYYGPYYYFGNNSLRKENLPCAFYRCFIDSGYIHKYAALKGMDPKKTNLLCCPVISRNDLRIYRYYASFQSWNNAIDFGFIVRKGNSFRVFEKQIPVDSMRTILSEVGFSAPHIERTIKRCEKLDGPNKRWKRCGTPGF